MSRPPSPPPELPGFTYVQPLGTGGFADVFLYEQQLPRRRVAVKVLLADRTSSSAAEEFTAEANVMAMLSTHPAIVTIYQAGVAGDGRPYLVMEYCPRPNLQVRARKEPFSVAEALRVGVQVAGAVETAHRAGVLHRDIKPANILVTEYNRPALTDFGIASTTGAVSEAAGMSIPWSPPESFAEPPRSGPRSDVYALGATLFTLLIGRSPFERVGERNTSADLIERIERMALPSLNRPDSPASLQTVLARAMAKNPDDRFPSAVAFARALQKVQIELTHSVTPIDIVDEHPSAEDLEDDGDGLTRVREVVSIDPSSPTSTRPSAVTQRKTPGVVAAEVPRFDKAEYTPQPVTEARETSDDDRTVARAPRVVAPTASTPGRSDVPAASEPGPEPAVGQAPRARRRWVWWVWAAAVVAVIVALVVFGNAITKALAPAPDPVTSESSEPQDVVSGVVPPVGELTGVRDGEAVEFSWTNPAAEEGDAFIWNQVTLEGAGKPEQTTDTRVRVDGASTTCIEVVLKRADGRASQPVRECVE